MCLCVCICTCLFKVYKCVCERGCICVGLCVCLFVLFTLDKMGVLILEHWLARIYYRFNSLIGER